MRSILESEDELQVCGEAIVFLCVRLQGWGQEGLRKAIARPLGGGLAHEQMQVWRVTYGRLEYLVPERTSATTRAIAGADSRCEGIHNRTLEGAFSLETRNNRSGAPCALSCFG